MFRLNDSVPRRQKLTNVLIYLIKSLVAGRTVSNGLLRSLARFSHVCVRFCGRSLEQHSLNPAKRVSPALVHRLHVFLRFLRAARYFASTYVLFMAVFTFFLPNFFRFIDTQVLENRSNKTNVYKEAASLSNFATMKAFCSF